LKSELQDRFNEFQRRLAGEVRLDGELLDELRNKHTRLIRNLAWRYVGRTRAQQIHLRLRKRPEGILITSKPQDPPFGWIFIYSGSWSQKRFFVCEEQIDIHNANTVLRVCELLHDRISRNYLPLKESTEKAFLSQISKIVAGEIKPSLEKDIAVQETTKPVIKIKRRKKNPFQLLPRSNRNEAKTISFTKSGFARVVRLLELVGKLKERQRTYPPENRKNLEGLIERVSDLKFQLNACSGSETPLRKEYGDRVENLDKKDYWVYYRSPSPTWRKMVGCAGWYVIDHQTLKTKAFIKTVVS
jgi:hypothetical protein